MAVLNSKYFPGNFTPICNSCGIVLCWDISKEEYEKLKEFWDNWKCGTCNPDHKGSKKRYIKGIGQI